MKRWIKILAFCLFPILIYEGIAVLSGLFLKAVLAVSGISGGKAGIWLEEEHILLITALAGTGAAACFLLLEIRMKKGEALALKSRKASLTWKSRFYLFMLAGGAALFLNSLISFFPFSQSALRAYSEVEAELKGGSVLLQIITVCLAGPAGEEGAFRVFAFWRLRSSDVGLGFFAAAFLSSLSFGFYHGSLVQGIYAFLLGLLLCWVMEKYRTAEAPVILHGAANGVSLLMTWAAAGYLTGKMSGIVLCICSGCVTAVFAAAIAGEKRD